MSEQMSASASLSGRRRIAPRWGAPVFVTAGLALPLVANGCVSDVPIPDCVRDQVPCTAEAGAGGTSSATGGDPSVAGGAASAAGSNEGGGAPMHSGGATAGSVAAGGGAEAGGVAGEGVAGESGAAGTPSSTPDECARCLMLPPDLTSPCIGRPFVESIHISGGTPPYQWELTPPVEGWSVVADPELPTRAILMSDEVAATTPSITLTAIDAEGKQKRRTFPLRGRTSCWFAYTAPSATGPTLHLLDPLTESPRDEVLEHNSGVYDFQFSPNGEHLVYRFATSEENPELGRLALVDLSTLEERELQNFGASVSRFAWSPDSTTLAVAFKVGDITYLGGVRRPPSGSASAPTILAPTPAFAESNLYWVDNHIVAYHATLNPDLANPGEFLDNPFGFKTGFHSRLSSNGFAAQQMHETFESTVVLEPRNHGFYLIAGFDALFTSFSAGAHNTSSHAFMSLLAPSGKYSALIDDGFVQVFPAEGGTIGLPAATAKQDDTCPMPLAWAQGVERFACVADVPNNDPGATTHGEVRIFDLHADSDLLEMSTVQGFCTDDVSRLDSASCATKREGYAYGVEHATGQARAFSASGRWFAFVTPGHEHSYLYWVDLAERPFAAGSGLSLDDQGTPATPTRLAFSPSERFLLLQRGTKLTLHDLITRETRFQQRGLVGSDLPCSDDYPNAPLEHCGDTQRAAPFLWSADSRQFAYRVADEIWVYDEPTLPTPKRFSLPATKCGAACAGQFAFQPPINL